MSPFLLSVLLSLVSATAYAGAAVIQERVAATTPEQPTAPLRHGSWWASVALNGTGALLHVAALAYGPLSLVQPLGALTIVFALPIAALFVRHKVTKRAWQGALLTTGGLAVLLGLTDGAEAQALTTTTRIGLAAGTLALVAALTLLGTRMRRPAVRSLTLAVAAGAAFGMASVFTKAVTENWTDLLSLGMIAILAPAGLLLSQAAYRGAGLSAPLATLTVVNPVIAAAIGIAAFGETFRFGATGLALAAFAALVTAGGLVLLTTESQPTTAPAAEPAKPAAPLPVRVPAQAAQEIVRLNHARPRRDLRHPPVRTERVLIHDGRRLGSRERARERQQEPLAAAACPGAGGPPP